MSTLAARRANLFKGTRVEGLQRVPGNQSLEIEALAVIRASIEAHATSSGRRISGNDLDRMLSAAQSQLRGLSLDDLRSISPSSSLVKTITDYSMAAAAAPDAKTAPGGQPVAGKEQEVADGQPRESLTARLHRIDLERAARANASSARFSSLAGDERLSPSALQNMAGARAEAMRLGMPWAANHPDLLKLGPAAIKAIAETNLRETGYKALRNGAYYEAPDIVAFAKHSKLRGFDAEKAAKSTEALVQALPPAEQRSTAEVLRRFDHAAAAYYANPNDAAARERFEAAGKAQKQRMEEIAQRSEADRARVQRLEDDKRVEQKFRATTVGNEHAATLTEQRATSEQQATGAAKDTAATAKATNLGGLDDEPTEKSGDPNAGKGTQPPAATVSPPAKGTPAKPPAPK